MTLLIITIFSLLFLSLSSGAITNEKQFQMTEDDLQATALAEMGILYQKTKLITIIDNFFANINVHFDAFLRTIDVNNINEDDLTESFKQFIKERLIDKLKNDLTNPPIKYLDSPNNTQFYKVINTESKTSTSSNEIIITFTSIGNNSEKEKQIKANFQLPIDNLGISLDECTVGDEPTLCKSKNQTGSTIPNGQQIPEPKNLPPCQGNNFLNGANCQYNGSPVLGNGNNEFVNTTVKITGRLDSNGNINNSEHSLIWVNEDMAAQNFNNGNNVQLHVGGNANFNGNINNLNNSIIEIMGVAVFSNNVQNMSNTNIYIGERANFNGHLDLENKSFAFINGDAIISQNLNVSNNSKLCVNGHLTVNGQVKGSNVYAKSSNNSKVNTNPDDFAANCAGGNDSNEGLKPIMTETNDDWNNLLDQTFDYY